MVNFSSKPKAAMGFYDTCTLLEIKGVATVDQPELRTNYKTP
jgi:hypothetical protein